MKSGECIRCHKKNVEIHYHHLSYKNKETVPLCTPCHTEVHRNHDSGFYPRDSREWKNDEKEKWWQKDPELKYKVEMRRLEDKRIYLEHQHQNQISIKK